jgi:hypothetical protein
MGQMMDEMVPVYQKYLSRSEADAITAFYLTPEGQSFLHKMPVIMGDAMPQMIKSMTTKMQPITEKMERRMQEIIKKYQSQMGASTAPKKRAPAAKSGTATRPAVKTAPKTAGAK